MTCRMNTSTDVNKLCQEEALCKDRLCSKNSFNVSCSSNMSSKLPYKEVMSWGKYFTKKPVLHSPNSLGGSRKFVDYFNHTAQTTL